MVSTCVHDVLDQENMSALQRGWVHAVEFDCARGARPFVALGLLIQDQSKGKSEVTPRHASGTFLLVPQSFYMIPSMLMQIDLRIFTKSALMRYM